MFEMLKDALKSVRPGAGASLVKITVQRADVPLSVAAEAAHATIMAMKQSRSHRGGSGGGGVGFADDDDDDNDGGGFGGGGGGTRVPTGVLYDIATIARDACRNAGGDTVAQVPAFTVTCRCTHLCDCWFSHSCLLRKCIHTTHTCMASSY